jgi:hypothetical protein
MKTTLTHKLHDAIEVSYQDQLLFKYIYEAKNPGVESPRPYFHPIRTLAGNEVSLFRPYDHLWHIGLTMCIANLSGENFWGGPTYTREKQGYIQLDNNGRIQHADWQEVSCDEEVHCIEHLKWITHAGETWLHEERQIVVSEIKPEEGYWNLDLGFRLTNSRFHFVHRRRKAGQMQGMVACSGAVHVRSCMEKYWELTAWRGQRVWASERRGWHLVADTMEMRPDQPYCLWINQKIPAIPTNGLCAMILMPVSVAHSCTMNTMFYNLMRIWHSLIM